MEFVRRQYPTVISAAKGIARRAVGKKPNFIPKDCNNQVTKIVDMAPKDINSPWAKFENLNTA
jgi:hypothetical protein